MIDRLLRAIRQAGASSESSTSRDGALSHAGETHALVVGLGAGVATALLLVAGAGFGSGLPAAVVVGWALGTRDIPDDADPHLVDVTREPAYALAGIVAGLLVGAGVAAALGALPPVGWWSW